MSVDVETLAVVHKKAISTRDGIEFHEVPGLLAQLRDAVIGGIGGDGAGAGHRSKLPMQAAALDLYTLIDRQISEVWSAAFRRVPGVEKPEALLSQWAAWVDEDRIVEVTRPETRRDEAGEHVYPIRIEKTAANLVAMWEAMIDAYFNPPSTAEIPAPCLHCGTRYVYRQADGETVRSSAMTFIRDRTTGATVRAECAACTTTWGPDRFEWLATQLGIDVAAKRAAHEQAEQKRAQQAHEPNEQEQER